MSFSCSTMFKYSCCCRISSAEITKSLLMHDLKFKKDNNGNKNNTQVNTYCNGFAPECLIW